jgi:hypothetical protein
MAQPPILMTGHGSLQNTDVETRLFQGTSAVVCKTKNELLEHDHTRYYIQEKTPTLYAGLPLLVEQNRIGQSTRNEDIQYGN